MIVKFDRRFCWKCNKLAWHESFMDMIKCLACQEVSTDDAPPPITYSVSESPVEGLLSSSGK